MRRGRTKHPTDIWMNDPKSKNDQDESWTSMQCRHHVDPIILVNSG